MTKIQRGAPAPKLPVTEEWRARVVAARKAASLSQQEIARKLGMSQGSYSRIESGETTSSDQVLRISELVGTSPPQVLVDEAERQWVEFGNALRARSPKLFAKALALVEAIASTDTDDE